MANMPRGEDYRRKYPTLRIPYKGEKMSVEMKSNIICSLASISKNKLIKAEGYRHLSGNLGSGLVGFLSQHN